MTPLERAYLYGIGILALMLGATRSVNHWIGRLEQRYWERRSQWATSTTDADAKRTSANATH